MVREATIDAGTFPSGLSGFQTGYLSGSQNGSKQGQVESLLEAFGGTALLPDFMRQLAKVRGYHRVGRLIRKSLKSEIASLKRKGKIAIEDGSIRLPD
jgi:hypothetical protein